MKTLKTLNIAVPCTLVLLGSVLVSNTLAATVAGGQYTVKVETSPGSGIYQQLGQIHGFKTDQNLEGFYSYSNHKYNGEPLDFQSNSAHIFIVESSTTGEIGLFSVNGSPYSTNTSWIEMKYKITGGEFDRIAVGDDNENDKEVWFETPTDHSLVHGFYGWDEGFNDGAVLPINDTNDDKTWTLKIDVLRLFEEFEGNDSGFNYPPFVSVDKMVFLSASSDDLSFAEDDMYIQQSLQDGTSFLITPDDTNIVETVSEPSNIKGLMVLGFLGGGAAFCKRRK